MKEPGTCRQTGTQECGREKRLREASAAPLSPDARDALDLFGLCGSQWRVGVNGATGLDYPAVALVADRVGLELTGEVLVLLRELEGDQVRAWAEQRERQEAKVKRA
jgi:hypothetical protein